jgi:hypothetical protein
MLAAAILIVNAWQSYGLTGAQLKSLASRALQVATKGKEEAKLAEKNADLVSVEQSQPPLFPPLAKAATSAAVTGETPSAGSLLQHPNQPAGVSATPEIDGRRSTVADDVIISGPEAERFPALLTRLESLGGMEAKLTPWGSTRRLYRFSCRAAIGELPSHSRHFESVADQPLIAVEDVVAKVSVWRMAQQKQAP